MAKQAELENPETGSIGNQINDASDVSNLALSDVEKVNIRLRNLNVRVEAFASLYAKIQETFRRFSRAGKRSEKSIKNILTNVDADFPAGSVSAIIGGSGSGKTTALNVLAERMSGNIFRATGDKHFNGDPRLSSIRSAYVMQQDILLPTLTVRETLRFAADLRLPDLRRKEDRWQIVEDVILELGLKECADTKIGTSVKRGCSGGEKRRTSIGVQLLANPSVLFLDEPTTGLDATSALQIVQTLRDLARKGRTIIVSIHQPRSEIWRLLDRVLLLSHGSPLYSGEIDSVLPYFKGHGFEIPPLVNPAEFLIDLAMVDSRTEDAETSSRTRVEALTTAWRAESHQYLLGDKESTQENVVPPTEMEIRQPQVVPSVRQFHVLTKRTFLCTVRDPMGLAGSMFEAIGMAVLTGWIFLNLDKSLQGTIMSSDVAHQC